MSNALGGNILKAFEHFTQSVALFEKLGDLRSLSSSLAAESILTSEPQTDTFVPARITSKEAVKMTERALQLATDIGWRSGQVFSYCTLVVNLVADGQYNRAMECMRNGAEIAEKIRHRQWQTYIDIVSGVVYLDLFSFDKARICFQSALAMAQESHSTHWIHVSCGFLATTLIKNNDLAGAGDLLEQFQLDDIPIITNGGRLVWAARADLALAKGNPQLALNFVKQMMDALSYSAKDVVVRLWMLRAEAFMAIAEKEADPAERQFLLKEAQDLLFAVLAEVQALNYRSKIWQIHQTLAKVFRLQDKNNEAEVEHQTAFQFVLGLADAISDRELRENFIHRAMEA